MTDYSRPVVLFKRLTVITDDLSQLLVRGSLPRVYAAVTCVLRGHMIVSCTFDGRVIVKTAKIVELVLVGSFGGFWSLPV
jgi:hypothetical protein